MSLVEAYRKEAEYAYRQLLESIEGITEGRAWAVVPSASDDYLHTDGSIHGIILHVASCKWAYGSFAFRNSELRWHQIADEIAEFEPSWTAAVDYLERGHAYWMASWSNLEDSMLDEIVPTNYENDLPAWRLLQIVHHHDSYHAGQNAIIRYATGPSQVHPPSVAEDIRTYCRDSRHW